ncbi:MAG TPA: sigma-70 family RNA polymerase sigma factor [Chitinophagaceae bacterium]|nr:sigma-70 family RNA polymerase sigma factor [Chitinophagaceae bacterium]
MNIKETFSFSDSSDEEIVRRVLAGEKHLYEKIMRKYNQRLYRIGISIVIDSEETQEIVQASYIKAYEHLSDFKFKSDFSTWLIRILINESYLHLHQRQRIGQIKERELKSATGNESPLQKLINKEVTDILEKALAQLPEKYRIVFIMREVQNMSTRETMECLNISKSNVKVRLKRAKEMLRNLLTEYYKIKDLYDFDEPRCDAVVKNVLTYIESIK